MAGSFRNRKLVVAFNGAFKRQSAFGVPMAASDIDTRHPQTTPTYPSKNVTREEVRDCSGEYVIAEEITSRLARLRFAFDADAYLLAGWLAYAQGVAAAPSGTRTNEVQTITPTGTVSGGTWNYEFEFEGLSDNVDIPWDATAAEIQAYIEALSSVGSGNVGVVGTLATTVVITYQGKLAAYNMPLAVVDDANITGGGTLAIVQTTAGASKTALITRTDDDQPPVQSIIVGFEGDTTDPDEYPDMVVNTVTIRGAVRGKLTVELELIGSADTIARVGYVFPECVNQTPIYTKDCRIKFDSTFIVDNLRDFVYNFSNNIFAGDDAFPYASIDVERLEHGDRTSSFEFTIYGSKGDSTYTAAESEAYKAVQLIMGPPSNRTVIDAPKTKMKLSESPITFSGEANRSSMIITGTPHYDKLTAGTPDNVIYYGSESTTFLASV
jgi:hypothetical protein